ncbi:MAG: hypothetical protein ACK4N5_15790, partial [Myxococcales bacterium]
ASARPLTWRDLLAAGLYSATIHGVFLLSLRAGEILLAALVALHYFTDARLWRFREDPALRRHLAAVGGPQEATA